MNKQVVIVGGGLGGLSAAIELQLRGFHVQLFEQNAALGGKMNEYRHSGYRFDTGPSLLTMPVVIEEMFLNAGENIADYLDILPVEPVCRYFWEDGATLDASSDAEQMTAEIKKFSSHDANNYKAFLLYARRIYNLTADLFLKSPIHERSSLFTRENLSTLLHLHQIDPLRSVHESISGFFRHPKIVQLFDRYATYNGSNPFEAPATLNIIPYVEYELGGFYVKGGMYRLGEAMEALARVLGVEIHVSAKVTKIVHQNRTARGIICNGEFIDSDYVLCNADVVSTYNELIEDFPQRRKRLNRLEPSLSGMVFMWGVAGQHPELQHHNIIFSGDYRAEFRQIFAEKRTPDDPTIYIAITSKTNPEHAPAGAENWFVMLNMPYLIEGQNWEEAQNRMRDIVFRKLKIMNIDISESVETERVITPQDFYRLYGSNRGSIYGISSNRRLTAFRRPPNRSREIKGLYFAGGSAHPGGGIPLALLSGKISAKLIAKDALQKSRNSGCQFHLPAGIAKNKLLDKAN